MTRLNVLVYSGSGTTTESVRHCVYTLQRLLSPHYAVTPVTGETLIKEPWSSSCALLCMPGGADLGTCRTLNGEGNRKITQFVRSGGAYIGFCAGGYYGSSRVEFEVGNRSMEVVGNRELRFFPGVCRGCAYKGFVYNSENGAKPAVLRREEEWISQDEKLPETFKSYYNGGGVFVDAKKYKEQGVEILASYTTNLDVDSGDSKAAVIYCRVGKGSAILTGTHPEFAACNLDRTQGNADYSKLVDDLAADDESRVSFLTACFKKLNLRVNTGSTAIPSLSKLYLTAADPSNVKALVDKFQEVVTITENQTKSIVGENDTFILESAGSINLETLALSDQTERSILVEGIVDYNKIPKHIQVYEDGYPSAANTPYFDHELYYEHLKQFQGQSIQSSDVMGSYLLYGEVVTSTNTMLDKNYQLLQRLPSGLTAVGTIQIAGRGRGTNQWVSPIGGLAFSTCVRHHWQLGSVAPVVFVQYLVALAIVEAIHTYGPGYRDLPVRLKWPNDIYAEDPALHDVKHDTLKERGYVKIGGILVNSSFSDNQYLLVVGCGINTTNASPTTSLNRIIDAINTQRAKKDLSSLPHFKHEILFAKIMVVFDEMYQKFCRQGFRPFEKKYYESWLHTNQVVRLDMEGGVRARIKGITMEDGLLRVDELDDQAHETGKSYTLQTDNNSFDFMKGLLKKKM